MKYQEWLKKLQIGDPVKVVDFWEGKYNTVVTQTTDRFIWLKFHDTNETIRFSRKTGYQMKGGMQMQAPA